MTPRFTFRLAVLSIFLLTLFGTLFGGAAVLRADMPMIDFPRPLSFAGSQLVLDGVDTSGLGKGTVLRFTVKQQDRSYGTFTTETDDQGRFTIALDAKGLFDRDSILVSIERGGGSWPKRLPTVRVSAASPANAVPAKPATNVEAAICTTCGSGTCRASSPELFTAGNEARDGDVQVIDGTVRTRLPVVSFPSRLLGFELVLHHQSLTSYAGPLGESWSHTYNTFIVETGEGEAWFVTPDLRTFRFERAGGATGGGWQPPEGFFGRVERDEKLQRWVFTEPAGTRFELLLGRRGLPGPLVAIAEPNGNRTAVRLNPSGLVERVVTDLGQEVGFTYGFGGRLTEVADPMHRTWRFGYDAKGNLTTVLPPATDAVAAGPGREITDRDLPEVLLRNCVRAPVFKYDDPHWPHQISRTIDPRGAVTVSYTYGGDGRVEARTVNGRAVTYVYQPGTDATPRPLAPLEATNRITRVIDRAGNVVDYEMHGPEGGPIAHKGAFGLRRQVEWTERGKGDPPLRPGGATVGGEPEYRERRWLHDCDCLSPIQVSQPFTPDDGLRFDDRKMPLDYPAELFAYNDRRQVTAHEVRGGPGESIREERTYAPIEQLSRMLTSTEPRGFDGSPLSAGLSFVHTYEYDIRGNLTAHSAPDVTRGVPARQPIRETWAYDEQGRIVGHQDANRNLTAYTYFSGPVAGGDVNTRGGFDGYLSAVTRGAAGSADPQAGLTTRFKVNALGMVTERTDPRGLVYVTERNALGEVTRQIEPVVTLAGGRQVQDETLFFYDGAGNRVMERRSNVDFDGTVPANTFIDRSWSYDAVGNRLSERVEVDADDAHDLVTRFAYDENDQLSAVQRPEGNRTFFTYDAWRLPFKTFYGVAPGGSPAAAYPTDKRADSLNGTPFIGVAVTDYDARGNAVRRKDGKGNLSSSFFDFRDRRVAERDANGNGAARTFDDASNLVLEEKGKVLDSGEVAAPLARTYHRYDEAGRRYETVLDADLASDESARVEPDDGHNSALRTGFDAAGRAVRRIDAEGNPATFAFDAADRITEEGDALGNRRLRFYDAGSNLIRIEELEVAGPGATGGAERYVTTSGFDELNRQVETHVRGLDEAIDHATTFAYDSRGNVRQTRDAEGNLAVSTFDDQNRLVRFQRLTSDGAAELVHHEHAYDRNGNKTLDLALADVGNPAAAQITRYAYDALDRQVRIVHPDSDDPVDGSGNGPDGVYDRIETAYDANSNVTAMKEQRGVVLTKEYDPGNRLTQVDVVPPPVPPDDLPLAGERRRTFGYDDLDRMTAARNDYALVEREHDPLSRVTAEVQSARLTGDGANEDYRETVRVESTYDRQGNRLTLSVLDLSAGTRRDLEVHQGFDALNRVESIDARHFAESGLRPVAGYTYFGPSRIQKKTLGNGAFLEESYDAKRRLAGHVWQAGGATAGQLLAGFEYDYDAEDNALFERFLHDAGRFDNFGYNPRYELTGASFGAASGVDYRTFSGPFDDRFAYDDLYNRREAVFGGTADSYAANAANEYTQIVRNARTFVPSHDAAGNAAAFPVRPSSGPESGRDVEAAGRYDAFNHLFEIQAGENPKQHNRYDALGRRIGILKLQETTAGTLAGQGSRRLILDGWTEVEERLLRPGLLAESASILERVYIHGPRLDELLLTAVDGNLDGKVSGVTTHPKNTPGGPDWEYYALDNHLGSVMALLDRDQAGRVLESYRYDAFGQSSVLASIATSGSALSPAINPFLFTGRRLDGETGVYYYRMRSMEPGMGRFVERDPMSAWKDWFSLGNAYGYAGNNPVTRHDPLGSMSLGSIPMLLDFENGAVFGGTCESTFGAKCDCPWGWGCEAGLFSCKCTPPPKASVATKNAANTCMSMPRNGSFLAILDLDLSTLPTSPWDCERGCSAAYSDCTSKVKLERKPNKYGKRPPPILFTSTKPLPLPDEDEFDNFGYLTGLQECADTWTKCQDGC
jgi:RHS repeat-associated protein